MKKFYRSANGELIPGESLPIFVKDNFGRYFLQDIEVYKDGKIICHGTGNFRRFIDVDRIDVFLYLEELAQLLDKGYLVTNIPAGAIIGISNLGAFRIETTTFFVEKKDILTMVQDLMHMLNDEPTSSDQCVEAFLRFTEEPTQHHQDLLRQAYERVPEHWKIWMLEDPENEDTPITAILARKVEEIDAEWLAEQRETYTYLGKNHEPTKSDQCVGAFLRFLDEPTQHHQDLLRQAYERVPERSKTAILQHIENEDTPITAILARKVEEIDAEWLAEQRETYTYLRTWPEIEKSWRESSDETSE